MKKHILLISTFILSFVLLVGNVNAAAELTCIYGLGTGIGNARQYAVIFSQDSDGNQTYFQNRKSSEIDDENWEKIDVETPKFYIVTDENGLERSYAKGYPHCPPCLDYKQPEKKNGKMRAYFEEYEKKEKKECNFYYVKLKKSENKAISQNDIGGVIDTKNEKWDFVCNYDTSEDSAISGITLSYNRNNYSISLESTNPNQDLDKKQGKFSPTELWKNNSNACPSYLKLEFEAQSDLKNIYLDKKGAVVHYTLLNNQPTSGNKQNSNSEPEPKNCQDLFGNEFIKKINEVMNIIRIAVPILLIIFGITDFFRATFSNNEDNMKKDRDRFIKRIIAAIIVFIIPFFVNLVLKIANSVWSDISTETCTTEQK